MLKKIWSRKSLLHETAAPGVMALLVYCKFVFFFFRRIIPNEIQWSRDCITIHTQLIILLKDELKHLMFWMKLCFTLEHFQIIAFLSMIMFLSITWFFFTISFLWLWSLFEIGAVRWEYSQYNIQCILFTDFLCYSYCYLYIGIINEYVNKFMLNAKNVNSCWTKTIPVLFGFMVFVCISYYIIRELSVYI